MDNRTILAVAATMGVVATFGYAAIAPLDSASFTKKFEMNAVGPNELDPAANTNEWNADATSYGATASLSGGYLLYDSTVYMNRYAWWDSVTDTSVYSDATGSTLEVSVRVDAVSSPNDEDKAFALFLGDAGGYAALTIGLNSVSFAGQGSLGTYDNTDTHHVFRVAQDANSNLFQVWRDGVQIGTDLPGVGAAHALWFGDGSEGYSSSGSVDYVRWTAGGYSPIPEPASLSLLGLSALMLRRRR